MEIREKPGADPQHPAQHRPSLPFTPFLSVCSRCPLLILPRAHSRSLPFPVPAWLLPHAGRGPGTDSEAVPADLVFDHHRGRLSLPDGNAPSLPLFKVVITDWSVDTFQLFVFPQRRRRHGPSCLMNHEKSLPTRGEERIDEPLESNGLPAPQRPCQLDRQVWTIFILLCSKRSQVITFFNRLKHFCHF